MKNLILTLSLIAGMLIAPGAASAAPLVCSGSSGLVYVLATSCTAASLGVFPGFTVGNCLVVQSDFSLGGGACGGGGGGVTSVTSANPLFLTVSPTTGDVVVGLPTDVRTCDGVAGSEFALLMPTNFGVHPGMTFNGNQVAFCGGALLSQNGFASASFGPADSTITTQQYAINSVGASLTAIGSSATDTVSGVDCQNYEIDINNNSPAFCISNGLKAGFASSVSIGGTSATIILGQTGAPSGACVSGSLYTRSDGGVGSTLYACEASAWVAAGTP